MDITLFNDIGTTIDNFLSLIRNASLGTKFNELQALVGSLIVITIMYKGYLVLAGKNQDPIRDLVWDIARKMLILTFVLNVDGWLDQSIEAINGFYSWAGGGAAMYAQMDKMTNIVFNNVGVLWDKSGGIFDLGDTITRLVIILAILIAYVAICFELFFAIIATSVTNAFLIVVLPLALFCFMFQPTKQVLTQWINLFMSNIFLLLFLLIFTSFFIDRISEIFNLDAYLSGEEVPFIQILIEIPIISAVLIQFIRVIKELAKNLAQVTLDSAISGSAVSRGAGSSIRALGGLGTSATKGTIGGVVGGGAVGAFKSGGMAGLAAYGVMNGTQSFGKKVLSQMRNK